MKRVHMKLLGLLLAVILIVSLLPFGALTALAEEPEGAITALGLSLAQPEPGPYGPAQVQIVSGEGFVLSRANWYNEAGIAPESFEAGQAYFAEIELEAQEGRIFTESTAVSLSGATLKTVQLLSETRLYLCTENITLPGGGSQGYNVWVGGVQVTADNKDDILGDGKASFDPATNTLTLDEAEISAWQDPSGALILSQDLDLTVKGKATLSAEEANLGIYSLNGSLILEGEFTLNTAGPALFSDKDLTVNDGIITGESSRMDTPCGNVKGDLTVKKGQLTLTGPAAGIVCGGVFTLEEEGVVKASATGIDCSADTQMIGLTADSVVMKGGDLTAKGVQAGLFVTKDLSISGGILAAQGQDTGILVAEGSLNAQDGTRRITADGKNAVTASQISLGSSLSVTEPAGGRISDDGKSIVDEAGSPVSHAVIQADVMRYTVRFDPLIGSDSIPSQSVVEGQTAQRPEDPQYGDFRFEGWYLDPADPVLYDFSTPVTRDMTLRGYWTATVTADVKDTDGNAGVGGLVSLGDAYQPSLSCNCWMEGGPFTVYCDPLEGYVFDHWEDVHGNPLGETETSFQFYVRTGPQSFTAVFQKVGYTVSFDTRGGTPATLELTTGKDGKLSEESLAQLQEITREGHSLTGWSLMPNGKPFDLANYTFTRDETVFALWTVNNYTVSFEANGGSATPSQVVRYLGTAYEPDDPVRPGHSFDGWYADEGLTQPFDFSTPIRHDTVLYAKWEQVVKYTVVSGGGSIYGKTSGKDLVITVRRTPKDAECFKHFTGVKIDGGELTYGTDYTAEAGSTVVTFKAACLSKLNSGTHIITFTFDDGKATTGLTVKAGSGGGNTRRGAGGNGSPETGDADALLWAGLLLVSSVGLGAVAVSSRRLRRAGR